MITQRKKVAVLLYDQVNAIDVAGPSEAFATIVDDRGRNAYETVTWAVENLIVRTESGVRLCADRALPIRPKADLLLIPGGRGIRDVKTLHKISTWLARHHNKFDRVVSVCTGAYALADSGLLDGRSVTTHWAHARDLQERYPNVDVNHDALFLSDGRFFSSGGVTSGIDLALDLIEADFGSQIAMRAARELVVFLRRPGNQAQFSLPLELQSGCKNTLTEACHWAASHLDSDLSVETLALRAGMSTRHFSRNFRQTYGQPPATFIKRLRLDFARTLLSQGVGLARVTAATGFKSTDGFSRAFEKEFGISTGDYRKRFYLKDIA